jgi:hypothetical protein
MLLVRAVVNASLPLYLVDHPDFRTFINALNPQYRLSYKKRLTNNLIPKFYSQVEARVKEEINSVETTSLSSDAWTDPRSKSFFAISSSIINESWEYKTYLLACNRMKGRHTADNIFSKYKDITNTFQINDKVTHNVTDAAANMRKALNKTSFLNKQIMDGIICEYNEQLEKSSSLISVTEEEEEDEDETINDADDLQASSQTTHNSDSESTTKTLTSDSNKNSGDIFSDIFEDEDNCPNRLNCVIHQLQLVVKDSKNDCKALERCVEHVATYVAKGSMSYLVKEKIELANGFMGKRNATRWNSEFNMCRSFLEFTDDQLGDIYGTKTVLTQSQRCTLNEFVLILEPFLESTLVLQKAAFSIGHVLPNYRGTFLFKFLNHFNFLIKTYKFYLRHSTLFKRIKKS